MHTHFTTDPIYFFHIKICQKWTLDRLCLFTKIPNWNCTHLFYIGIVAILQILYYSWTGRRNCHKLQPLDLVHEYLGDRVSLYFQVLRTKVSKLDVAFYDIDGFMSYFSRSDSTHGTFCNIVVDKTTNWSRGHT